MKKGLHHVAISAINYEETKAFYRDTFGMETVFELEFSDGKYNITEQLGGSAEPLVDIITGLNGCSGKQVMLRVGNSHLEIFGFDSPLPKLRDPEWEVFDHGLSHLCFQVSNIEAWYERLIKQGVRFHCEPQDFGPVKCTYARDPEGNVVELLDPQESGQNLNIENLDMVSSISLTEGDDNLIAKGLHHGGISVTNVEEMKAFYCDVIGLEIVFEMDYSDGRFDTIWQTKGSAGMNVMFRTDNSFFEIFEFHSPVPKPRDPHWRMCDYGMSHICLEVENLQSWYEQLKAKGVKFSCEPQNFGDVKATYGYDPEGNIIEFKEVLDSGRHMSVLK